MAEIYHVTAPHFCAGLIVVDGYCVEAVPIIDFARGRHIGRTLEYFRRKGWTVEVTSFPGDGPAGVRPAPRA